MGQILFDVGASKAVITAGKTCQQVSSVVVADGDGTSPNLLTVKTVPVVVNSAVTQMAIADGKRERRETTP